VIAILVLLALIAGTVSLVLGELFKPTLALSSSIVEPGEILTVTATHLPANQLGTVELLSELFTWPYGADANGSLSKSITIPDRIGIGDHHISVCWDNSCPLRAPLTVVAPGTLPSPTPSGNSSPTASGTPVAKGTPGRSPSPGRSPTANPTASPRPTPKPTPTPTSNPCPTPRAGAVLTASSTTVVGGGTVTLSGTNFTPRKVVTLKYYAGSTLSKTWTTVVACNGTFTSSVTTLGTLVIRTDHVTARDSAGRTASTGNITVLV
jgi:hypothetical protein